MEPKVSIIILNWNGWQDTIECLESVYQINYTNYDVLIVDNCSEDNSISKIKKYLNGDLTIKSDFFNFNYENKPIKFIEFDEKDLKKNMDKYKNYKTFILKNNMNYGYAKGNNIAIEFCVEKLKPDYILILNNDTVVNQNFLSELLKCYKNQLIAAIQPAIYFYENKNEIWSIGGKFNLLTGKQSEFKYTNKEIINTDIINGAAMMISTYALEKVGLIDARYFMYMEETDWCYRARKLGFSLKVCSKSKVWHKGFSSSKKNKSLVLDYYWTRNLILFYRKNIKWNIPIFFLFFIPNLILRSGYLILNHQSPQGCILGFIDGIRGKTGIK